MCAISSRAPSECGSAFRSRSPRRVFFGWCESSRQLHPFRACSFRGELQPCWIAPWKLSFAARCRRSSWFVCACRVPRSCACCGSAARSRSQRVWIASRWCGRAPPLFSFALTTDCAPGGSGLPSFPPRLRRARIPAPGGDRGRAWVPDYPGSIPRRRSEPIPRARRRSAGSWSFASCLRAASVAVLSSLSGRLRDARRMPRDVPQRELARAFRATASRSWSPRSIRSVEASIEGAPRIVAVSLPIASSRGRRALCEPSSTCQVAMLRHHRVAVYIVVFRSEGWFKLKTRAP